MRPHGQVTQVRGVYLQVTWATGQLTQPQLPHTICIGLIGQEFLSHSPSFLSFSLNFEDTDGLAWTFGEADKLKCMLTCVRNGHTHTCTDTDRYVYYSERSAL